ncbi:hypothetical protein EJO31_04775 [Salmonella enterica subsp. enterica serovar Kottbus]|nr:hypothetical protein [Salmonella enterica subsp. enterica serovar Kottbus]
MRKSYFSVSIYLPFEKPFLGYALYGVWIGIAISVAIIGLVTAMIYLSKSSVLIVKPETE